MLTIKHSSTPNSPKQTHQTAESPAPVPLTSAQAVPTTAPSPSDDNSAARTADVAAQVAMTKASVDEALADPATAFAAYLDTHLADYNATLAAGGEPSPAQRALAPLLSSPSARQGRQAVFSSNLRKIAAYNRRSGEDLAYGITGFTHLTASEFKAAYLKPMAPLKDRLSNGGRRLAETDDDADLGVPYECGSQVSFPFGKVSPPSAFDWRNVDGVSYVTDVRNQASCGSCASFAATATLETYVAHRFRKEGFSRDNADLSEQDNMDCTIGDQCEGWLPSYYLDRATCRGVVFESVVGYRAKDVDSCTNTQRYLVDLKGFSVVPANERAMAQAVSHAPVAIAMAANSAFQFYKGGAFPCASDSTGINHAITVVGWDDTVTMKSGENWHVWHVKNSWGKTWGPNGYVLMRKDCRGTGSLKMYSEGYNVVPVGKAV